MPKNIPILLVDDDLVDVKTVQRAFREHHLTNPLYITGNGEEALGFLRREGRYAQSADAPRPGLILLDLNMPVMNGIEFLRIIKADDSLKSIPVVVLTSSRDSPDRVASYKLGVAGYITKPVDFSKFLEAVKIFDLYWSLCELP